MGGPEELGGGGPVSVTFPGMPCTGVGPGGPSETGGGSGEPASELALPTLASVLTAVVTGGGAVPALLTSGFSMPGGPCSRVEVGVGGPAGGPGMAESGEASLLALPDTAGGRIPGSFFCALPGTTLPSGLGGPVGGPGSILTATCLGGDSGGPGRSVVAEADDVLRGSSVGGSAGSSAKDTYFRCFEVGVAGADMALGRRQFGGGAGSPGGGDKAAVAFFTRFPFFVPLRGWPEGGGGSTVSNGERTGLCVAFGDGGAPSSGRGGSLLERGLTLGDPAGGASGRIRRKLEGTHPSAAGSSSL